MKEQGKGRGSGRRNIWAISMLPLYLSKTAGAENWEMLLERIGEWFTDQPTSRWKPKTKRKAITCLWKQNKHRWDILIDQ